MRAGKQVVLAFTLIVSVTGCPREKRGETPAGPGNGRGQPPGVIDASLAPTGQFDADGWPPILWGMTPDEAKAALTAGQIVFEPEEMRAYFESKPGQMEHTNSLFLRMKGLPLPGNVAFEHSVLEGVFFQAQLPFSEAGQLAHVAALERRYGPGQRSGGGTQRIVKWQSKTTMLEVYLGTAPDWSLMERWAPLEDK